MVSENLGININLNLKGLESVAKVNNNFKSLKTAIKNSSLELKNFRKDLSLIKAIENTKVKLEIQRENLKGELLSISNTLKGGAFVLPVKLAIDFESSMADVKKVVDFSSKSELKSFSDDILKLSRIIPLSANELATITASGGQLGIAKDELLEFTQIVAKMGVAFDMSAEQSGEAIANLKNVLSLNMKEVQSLGDTINHLSDNSAAKASAIVETISRVGGVAKIFKLTADQTAALSSAFISLGKPPQVAGTAINTLLSKMLTAPQQTKEFQEALQKLGLDSSYLALSIQNNPQKALEQFLNVLENVKDSEKMGVFTNLFGVGYADDMALLVSSLPEYKKALGLINDENKKGSMQKEFENRSSTTANSLILLKSAFQELGINLGSVFLPAISKIVKGIFFLVTSFTNLLNIISALNTIISYTIASFLLFKPAFLIFKLGKSYILDTILSIRKFISVLRIKLALFRSLNIIQALNNRLIAIAIALKKGYTAVIGVLSKAFNFLKLSIFTTAGALKVLRFALISTGIGAIVVALGMGASYLIQKWEAVKEFFSSLFTPIVKAWDYLFGNWFKSIGDNLSWLFDSFGKIASFIGDLFSFGDDISSKDISSNINYSSLDLIPVSSSKVQTQSLVNTPINITFSGDFSLFANSNGQFDLKSFQAQLTKSVIQALNKEQFNRANTSIRG